MFGVRAHNVCVCVCVITFKYLYLLVVVLLSTCKHYFKIIIHL